MSEKVYQSFEAFENDCNGCTRREDLCQECAWTEAQKAPLARVEELEGMVKKALEVLEKIRGEDHSSCLVALSVLKDILQGNK